MACCSVRTRPRGQHPWALDPTISSCHVCRRRFCPAAIVVVVVVVVVTAVFVVVCGGRYFTWHTALLGSLLNLAILFLISWEFALVSLAAMIAIVLLLQFTGKSKDWGDVSQALVYHQVRKWLLVLDDAESGHTKYWRPSFLVLVDDMQRPYNLLGCLETLKKGGLLVLGGIVVGDLARMGAARRNVRRAWLQLIKKLNLKAFAQVGVAADVQTAYQVLVTCAGLGGLDTNTVVIPLFLPPHVRQTRSQRAGVRPHPLFGGSSSVGASGTGVPDDDDDDGEVVLQMQAKERSGSYYEGMAARLDNVAPIVSPYLAGRTAAASGVGDGGEAKDGGGDDVVSRRKSGPPSANAISSAQQWVGVLKSTLLLDRNILVEVRTRVLGYGALRWARRRSTLARLGPPLCRELHAGRVCVGRSSAPRAHVCVCVCVCVDRACVRLVRSCGRLEGPSHACLPGALVTTLPVCCPPACHARTCVCACVCAASPSVTDRPADPTDPWHRRRTFRPCRRTRRCL